MTDFTYLKNWLEGPNPRPVVLECQVSRSGLSMSVYDREKLLYRINGCGFDRLGCALAEFLEALYQPELVSLRDFDDEMQLKPLPGFHRGPGRIHLEGARGFESMSAIAEAIGLTVQVHETRSSTLLIIQKVK